MAKFSINRLLDTSKMATTKAGGELRDLLDYLALFSEQVLRAFRNQLTFQDNFACFVKDYTLVHNTETTIITDGTTPAGIIPLRVYSSTTGIDSLSWWLNDAGQTVVKVGFVGAPSGAIKIQLVILTA